MRLYGEPVEESTASTGRLSTACGYVVSDLAVRPGGARLRKDHVIGQGGASANLAKKVVHKPVDNLPDLGTGSGVQAVHLAGRTRRITATDLSPRALELAALSFALPDLVADGFFDIIG